jgi:DNA sulfur modification protein DndB
MAGVSSGGSDKHMLNNVMLTADLTSLARHKFKPNESKTVKSVLADDCVAEGWTVVKKRDKTVTLSRNKPHNISLEDRAWSLLNRMGFTYLSGEGGAILEVDTLTNQLDVVGIDNEIAVAIECKSSEVVSKRSKFQEELSKLDGSREEFTKSIRTQFPTDYKRQIVLAMFLHNSYLSQTDKDRAEQKKIVLFDRHDLEYYEQLIKHIGPAAKYQFLSDLVPGKTIQGLKIRIPAIRTKMGGYNCFTFSMSPEYLLKISYVSHRSRGNKSDAPTYQRMVQKSRLRNIREYIDANNVFPTNIVISIDKKYLDFHRVTQEVEDQNDQEIGILGWLDIRPAYKCAWIIDGQHRLFGYSGHPKAGKSLVSVLAFEGLPEGNQAAMFTDINSKQKAVSKSLLLELLVDLKKDADKPQTKIEAVTCQAVIDLGRDPDSALFERIQSSDAIKTSKCCISLTSIFNVVQDTHFFIEKEKDGNIIEYGPLWHPSGEFSEMQERTTAILKSWLNTVRERAREWWDKGSEEGGGLAMNDGVATCILVLDNILKYLEEKAKAKLVGYDTEDLIELTSKYAVALGDYFADTSEGERRQFRAYRAKEGLKTRLRHCQKALREKFPEYNPVGLDDYLQLELKQSNLKGKEIVDRIEVTLQRLVIDELKREYGDDWWINGMPRKIRIPVMAKYEEDDGKRGGRECYLDFIDYRDIIIDKNNWRLFENILSYGKGSHKDKTEWIVKINENMRRIVSHASSGQFLSAEQLAELQGYDEWLLRQVSGNPAIN